MSHVFFYIMWMGWCMCVVSHCLLFPRYSLWEEGKPAGAVWCSCQCSALLQHCCRPSTPLHDDSIPWWQWLISTGYCTLPHCRNCSGMFWGTWQRVESVNLASKSPCYHSDQPSVRCPGKLSPIHGGHTSKLTGLQGSATNIWRCPVKHVLWSPGLFGSELLCWQEGDLHNIMQVVLILWLNVYVAGEYGLKINIKVPNIMSFVHVYMCLSVCLFVCLFVSLLFIFVIL